MFKDIDWSNVAERCFWTFLEGFLGCISFDAPLDTAAVAAAVMAGLSCMKTVILDLIRSRETDV